MVLFILIICHDGRIIQLSDIKASIIRAQQFPAELLIPALNSGQSCQRSLQ